MLRQGGRDAAGRRVRLDVPASEGVRPGSVLVVDWWAAELPASTLTIVTVAEESTETMAATDGADEAPEDAAEVEREFRRLIGLV